MHPERWKKIWSIYDSVREEPPDGRERCLRRLCGGDESLREEVQRLLDSDARGDLAPSWLEAGAPASLLMPPRDSPSGDEEKGSPELSPSARELVRLGALLGPLATSTQAVSEGVVLGEYRLGPRLGEGGMGVVHRATQESLGRTVAVKVIRPGSQCSNFAREHFEREARAIARLDHPHIARVYSYGEAHGIRYLAMEYIAGQGLDELLEEARERGTPVPRMQVLTWMRDLAEALQHAHEHGVVHRDVKPSNVRIDPSGRAVLLDFGLARTLDPRSTTLTGAFLGSSPYASPEQVRVDAQLGPLSDVYSLGVSLYEALAGRRPFLGETREQLFHQTLNTPPPPLRSLAPGTSREVCTVVHKALEKQPQDRYVSAAAFAADLDALVSLRPILARPPGPWRRTERWIRRNPRTSAALSIAVLAIAALPTGLWLQRGAERQAQAAESLARAERLLAMYPLVHVESARIGLPMIVEPGGDPGPTSGTAPMRDDIAAEMETFLGEAERLQSSLAGRAQQLRQELAFLRMARMFARGDRARAQQSAEEIGLDERWYREIRDRFGVDVSLEGIDVFLVSRESHCLGFVLDVQGDRIAIGTPRSEVQGDSRGRVSVMRKEGAAWRLEARVVAPEGIADDEFGTAVALDAERLFVTRSRTPSQAGGEQVCALHVFALDGGEWKHEQAVPGEDLGMFVGASLAVDGARVLVGDPDAPRGGRVSAVRREGRQWVAEPALTPAAAEGPWGFGRGMALEGDTLAIAAPSPSGDEGRVHSYRRDPDGWRQHQELRAEGEEPSLYFGVGLAVHGDWLVARSRADGIHPGEVQIFRRPGPHADWEHFQTLVSPSQTADNFGVCLSAAPGLLLVGASSAGPGGGAGAAYLYRLAETGWELAAKLVASDGGTGDRFGEVVSLDPERAVVGAPFNDSDGRDQGAVYVYELEAVLRPEAGRVLPEDGPLREMDRVLAQLLAAQSPDGAFRDRSSAGVPHGGNPAWDESGPALTALAVQQLPWWAEKMPAELAARTAEATERARHYLRSWAAGPTRTVDAFNRCYVLEALLQLGEQDLAQCVVDEILLQQSPTGGWDYGPDRPGDSVSLAHGLLALQSARQAGLVVPPAPLRAATRALRALRWDDRRFAYRDLSESPRHPTEGRWITRDPVCALALRRAGADEDGGLEAALGEFLRYQQNPRFDDGQTPLYNHAIWSAIYYHFAHHQAWRASFDLEPELGAQLRHRVRRGVLDALRAELLRDPSRSAPRGQVYGMLVALEVLREGMP